MSSSVTVRPVRGVRGIGLFAIIVGIIMILAGGTTYGMVTSQLRDENITVSDDAQFLGGKRVQDPLTAYAQAEVINKHALKATDGQTYAQLPQDDPRRTTVMNASFLRASLFTSVVAFGVAILVFALGILFLLVGIALRRLAKGDVTVLDVVPASQAASTGPAAPVAPAAAPVAPARPAAPPARPAAPVEPPERTSSRHAAPAEDVTPAAAQRQATPVVDRTEPEAPTAVDDTAARPPSQAGPAHTQDGAARAEDDAARTDEGAARPEDGTTGDGRSGEPRA